MQQERQLTMSSIIRRIPPHVLVMGLFAAITAFALLAFLNPM